MSNHVMVDIETLGVGAFPVILSIGAVRFDPAASGIGSPETVNSMPHVLFFYRMISIDSCLEVGAKIEGSTLNWWMQPELEPARPFSFDRPDSPERPRELGEALREFAGWYQWSGIEGEAIWGHGATFDVTILQSAYRATGRSAPFKYRDPRDTRTLFALAEPDWPANPVLHHPLWDAWCQARAVQSSYAKLLRKEFAPCPPIQPAS